MGAVLLLRAERRRHPSRRGAEQAVEAKNLDPRFHREDALERLKNHSADHYAGLYNVMKGVTLAAAGITLVRLTGGYPAERLPLFVIGLIAIAITYNGAIIGQTVVHLRTNFADVLLPMCLTVAEFLLIGTAAAEPKTEAIPEYWLLALAAWQILAACVVASVARRLEERAYSPDLRPALRDYRKRQWIDACMAASTGVITLGFWLTQRNHLAAMDLAESLFLLFTFATLVGAIVHHEQTRSQLEKSLGELLTLPGPKQ